MRKFTWKYVDGTFGLICLNGCDKIPVASILATSLCAHFHSANMLRAYLSALLLNNSDLGRLDSRAFGKGIEISIEKN